MSDSALPDPPVSPDIDITGLDGFMLNVQRLFASELWALSTGDEFKAALGLWGRAWQQSPAGSLPDDERVLSAFSGAGSKWKKVRDVALRGFVKCSDGRLYHAVLCEDVRNAAKKREAFKERTKAATEARKSRVAQRGDDVTLTIDDDVTLNVTSVQGQGQLSKKEEQGKALALVPVAASAGSPPAQPMPRPDIVSMADRGAAIVAADPELAAAKAIIAAFDEVQEEVFAERRRPYPASSDLTAARLWLEAGADLELCRWVFSAQAQKMLSAGKEPPKSLNFHNEDIRNAIASPPKRDFPTGISPAEQPRTDPVREKWFGRLENYFKTGLWLPSWGEKPCAPGGIRSERAEYPEDLANELRPTSSRDDKTEAA
ncbi:MAG TPA: DUF1376 domain-containing protein [Aliidongia sp.]|uniref:DUF1376 domain-containing protein n=1 Tax=Aliidongia sp. TaxID=1914230 RepID=UPI002DDD34C2|nr:DUF1376 domain-containing protein [Aliidongia sp.]HEV2674127.1 DUF1376 domain-containing protein [Aliidongia sp.]